MAWRERPGESARELGSPLALHVGIREPSGLEPEMLELVPEPGRLRALEPAAVARPGREEESRSVAAKRADLSAREERGIVGAQYPFRRMPEGAVMQRMEIAAPRLDRSEQGGVAKADVGGAVPSGG